MLLTVEAFLLEPAQNLVSFEDLKLVGPFLTLVLVEEFDHVSVMVELYQAEHVVRAKLRHVNLADVRARV